MSNLTFAIAPSNKISKINPRLFGSFVEHLGRAVYSGIYEPRHPESDNQGFRRDVINLVRELNVSTVRYPGGNYVSGFNWRDGVGPKKERPVRLDYAWTSKETNQFGISEFNQWCKQAHVEPMIAVNLGTGTPQEAGYFIEYCNHPGGTDISDLRIQHGDTQPYNFKLWCLGNEMDGSWQTGHMTAIDYARKARETAKILRCVDPEVELIACGSSGSKMDTFPTWDRVVLEELYDYIDYISCHQYYENEGKDSDFLASFVNMDNFIETIVNTANYVKAQKRGKKDIMISFDEWNVWYQHGGSSDASVEDKEDRFKIAPPLLENRYSFLDALVVGGLLCSLINHCDRVKMGSLAQLVNVIAPIFTQEGGSAIRQTIFWPFSMVANAAKGTALNHFIPAGTFSSKYGDARNIQSAVVHNEDDSKLCVFALNNHFTESFTLDIDLSAFGQSQLTEHLILRSDDLHAKNTFEQPDRIAPQKVDYPQGSSTITLPPLSWSRITFDLS